MEVTRLTLNCVNLPEVEGLSFPDVHFNTKLYAAWINKSSQHLAFSLAPLCSTMEAEDLGAIIHLKDKDTGTFVSGYLYSDYELIDIADYDFTKGRLHVLMQAIPHFDKYAMIAITGPLTFLSSFIDSKKVLTAYRKHPEKETLLFKKYVQNQLNYILECKKQGVDIFSLAEPMATVETLGPKYFKKLADLCFIPLLKSGHRFHLCPNLARGLIALNDLIPHEVPFDGRYQDALRQSKYTLIGGFCIHSNPTIKQYYYYEINHEL